MGFLSKGAIAIPAFVLAILFVGCGVRDGQPTFNLLANEIMNVSLELTTALNQETAIPQQHDQSPASGLLVKLLGRSGWNCRLEPASRKETPTVIASRRNCQLQVCMIADPGGGSEPLVLIFGRFAGTQLCATCVIGFSASEPPESHWKAGDIIRIRI